MDSLARLPVLSEIVATLWCAPGYTTMLPPDYVWQLQGELWMRGVPAGRSYTTVDGVAQAVLEALPDGGMVVLLLIGASLWKAPAGLLMPEDGPDGGPTWLPFTAAEVTAAITTVVDWEAANRLLVDRTLMVLTVPEHAATGITAQFLEFSPR